MISQSTIDEVEAFHKYEDERRDREESEKLVKDATSELLSLLEKAGLTLRESVKLLMAAGVNEPDILATLNRTMTGE